MTVHLEIPPRPRHHDDRGEHEGGEPRRYLFS